MNTQELISVTENETWKLDYQMATLAHNLEKYCETAAQMPARLEDAWRVTVARLLSGEIKNPEAEGQAIEAALNKLADEQAHVDEIIAVVQKAGYEIKGVENLEKSKQEFAAHRAKFRAKWPFVDRKAVAASRSQIDRGEYRPIEELLNGSEMPQNERV
jgi:type IV secretory pathway VirD2 relaxase